MNDALVADTSLLINFFNGHSAARKILQNKSIWISGITEIEVLASANLTVKERTIVKNFVDEIYIVDLVSQSKILQLISE